MFFSVFSFMESIDFETSRNNIVEKQPESPQQG